MTRENLAGKMAQRQQYKRKSTLLVLVVDAVLKLRTTWMGPRAEGGLLYREGRVRALVIESE